MVGGLVYKFIEIAKNAYEDALTQLNADKVKIYIINQNRGLHMIAHTYLISSEN